MPKTLTSSELQIGSSTLNLILLVAGYSPYTALSCGKTRLQEEIDRPIHSERNVGTKHMKIFERSPCLVCLPDIPLITYNNIASNV